MADKTTTQAGDISLAATWGGTLPTAGQTAALGYAATLPTGKTFTALSLDLAGFALVATGTGTIIANIIALETLDDTASTGLTISGNAATTANAYWTCKGITTINGTITCGGSGSCSSNGLTVNSGAHLTATGLITATISSVAVTYQGICNLGTITGNVYGENLDSGPGVKSSGVIVGNVTGISTYDVGVFNDIAGVMTGKVTGQSTNCTGVYNYKGTINGDVAASSVGSGGVGLNNISGTINGNVVSVANDCEAIVNSRAGPTGSRGIINGSVSGTSNTGTGVKNYYGTINLIGPLVAVSTNGQNLINLNGTIQNGPISSRTKLKFLPQITPGAAFGLAIQAATGTVQSDAAAALGVNATLAKLDSILEVVP